MAHIHYFKSTWHTSIINVFKYLVIEILSFLSFEFLVLIFRNSGTCMLYKGGACAQSLNNTLPAYRNTPRFFDNKYGQAYTEIILKEIVTLISGGIKNKECQYLLKNVFCHYTLTPCKPDGKSVLPFCKEDCLAIFQKCAGPLQQAVGFVTVLIIKERVNFVHTGLPNCSIYKFEKEHDPNKNETCIKTGFFSKSPSFFLLFFVLKRSRNPKRFFDMLKCIYSSIQKIRVQSDLLICILKTIIAKRANKTLL